MVSGPSRLRRDDRSARQRQGAQAYRASLPSSAGRTEELYSPEECYTVTYDRQSRLQTYYYRPSREYTF